MNVLLDTCAIVWLGKGTSDLTVATRDIVLSPDTAVHVSPVSGGEIACACERKRLELDKHWRTWFRHAISHGAWTVVPVSLEIMEEAYSLPGDFHADPADRLLVATARLRGYTIITGDHRILEYPHVRSMA